MPAEVIIVGYGHAGRIHRRAYESLGDLGRVAAVVEPDRARHAEIGQALPGVPVFGGLDDALQAAGHDVIVDFCVPAKSNLELVETALRHGVHKFLIEKPLGWDVDSSHRMVARLGHCEVVYLDTYAASNGVQQLLERIGARASAPRRVDVLFHKDRVPDSRVQRGFAHDAVPSAWMIEGPHMLSIARQIAGEIAHVASASTFDMPLGSEEILRDHGGGLALLEHESGAVTHLELNLCSSRNARRVEVVLEDGTRMSVELPPSKSATQVSTLEIQLPGGGREVLQVDDRPMENCVRNAIRHLAGEKVRVSSMADGLAVCNIVERMTERTRFWQSVPRRWQYFGPPLRPCPDDIGIMEAQVAAWQEAHAGASCHVMLCGVTPEIADMAWPPGTRLWGVEKSLSMIEQVWPARGRPGWQVLQAEWTRLPFAAGSFDIVIGDGCLTSLVYPAQQLTFLQSVRDVMRDGAVLIMRHFAQAPTPERTADVFCDLAAGKIGSFHAFKWRLAMSLQRDPAEGVRVDDIWKAWAEARVATPWARETVGTIDTYRGSDHRLTFTTLDQIRELHARLFTERACIVPGYELGDRCPILVYAL